MIGVSAKSILHLMLAAKRLELKEINEDKIFEALVSEINIHNCWSIREIAVEAGFGYNAVQTVDAWINGNFSSIVSQPNFLDFQKRDVNKY